MLNSCAGTGPRNAGWRDYGSRVGIWRLMEMIDESARWYEVFYLQ
jgi:hypothetical protein